MTGDSLTLSTLGKIFSGQHSELFFLFKKIVSTRVNLHEIPMPVLGKKYEKYNQRNQFVVR